MQGLWFSSLTSHFHFSKPLVTVAQSYFPCSKITPTAPDLSLTSLLLHSRTKPHMSDSSYDIALCSSQPRIPDTLSPPQAQDTAFTLVHTGLRTLQNHNLPLALFFWALPSLGISPSSLLGSSAPSPFRIFLALPLSLCPQPAWDGRQRVKTSCKCSS